MTKSSITANRAKRPPKAAVRSAHRKSQAQPPRPGPSDVIADRFDIDKVDCAPSWKFGFSLHLGGDGGHWSGRVGRMEMPQQRAVDLALKILGFAHEWGTNFTPAQRKRIAEFALSPVYEKRQRAVWDQYHAREITLEQTKHLNEEVRTQYLYDVEALLAADTVQN